jgi:predicted transcriptional regulator
MLDLEVVAHIRLLQRLGWGTKRIAVEVGVARNSVRRYLRQGAAAEKQES